MTDLLQNLMIMAAIDGKLTESELGFLSERAQLWRVTPVQFKKTMSAAVQPEADFVIPPTEGERLEMLSELIQMMAADGQLVDVEKKFLAAVTVGMQVSTAELNRMIDELTAD